jgi:hypothetical protein
LKGIIAKWADGGYHPEATRWYKVKNLAYSQMVERWELLQRRRTAAVA